MGNESILCLGSEIFSEEKTMRFADQSLSELAINIPMASALFRRNRLDFCCGGRQTLREACEKRDLSLVVMEQELEALGSKKESRPEINLSDMTDFIVKRYHDDLRVRLPELITLASKVERVHVDHSACPHGLTNLLTHMQNELFAHMMKEETVLFPMIRMQKGSRAIMPITVMKAEHEIHGRQLEELHRLTSDFMTPDGACGTWRALYAGLEKLEEELMEHIHLENNVLFPRALES
jgi:regulator of cell morphogenesis and NO signaling